MRRSSFSHFFTSVCSQRLLCIGLLGETHSDYCNLLKSPPQKKKKKTPCAGSCVCFYFSFVFSDITFHTRPAQNRLPSCRCSALFGARRLYKSLSPPCFVDRLSVRRSHSAFCAFCTPRALHKVQGMVCASPSRLDVLCAAVYMKSHRQGNDWINTFSSGSTSEQRAQSGVMEAVAERTMLSFLCLFAL